MVDACDQPSSFHHLYEDGARITDKIEAIATRVYGARDVVYYDAAEAKIADFTARGLDQLPVCMAKTHLSLSADPTLLNVPSDFRLSVRDVRAYTGAGWLVPLCGDIQTMPGLGKNAAAFQVDIDADGSHGRPVSEMLAVVKCAADQLRAAHGDRLRRRDACPN